MKLQALKDLVQAARNLRADDRRAPIPWDADGVILDLIWAVESMIEDYEAGLPPVEE